MSIPRSITEIRFIPLEQGAEIPRRETAGAACYDLIANEKGILSPTRARLTISTGIGLELPPDHVGLVCSRSGLASKHGVFVLNAPGIIDPDYQGPIKVILGLQPRDLLWPETNATYEFFPGMRIAQLLILRVGELISGTATIFSGTTERGADGLGSTGLN